MKARALMPPLAWGTLALSACTSLTGLDGGSSYSCKAPDGVTCDSVSGVYANALADNLPSQRRRTQASASPAAAASSTGTSRAITVSSPPTPVALRSAPRILRLWFKPWEDADHDLYDQGYVYVQVDAGHWQIEHVQRQIRKAYAPVKPPPRTTAATAKDARAVPPDALPVQRPPLNGPATTPPNPRPGAADSDQ
jgi:conjugal transfer pilus assembly protein TraV